MEAVKENEQTERESAEVKLEGVLDEVRETPEPPKEYLFTDEQQKELDDLMENMRANYMTIEELSRRNREYSQKLHETIREAHPDLVGKEYAYNPTTKKIQFRLEQ